MVLSPWQRAMNARRQAYLRQLSRNQAYQEARRRMAQEIANQPLDPPSPERERRVFDALASLTQPSITYDPDIDLPPADGWDYNLSADQMYWEAEREMEKWDDFVKDLKKKPRYGEDARSYIKE